MTRIGSEMDAEDPEESVVSDKGLDPNGDSMTEDRFDVLDPVDVLDAFREEAGLSHGELWLRYFELGGMSTGFDLNAFLYGVLAPSDQDHDVIALALNERFAELGSVQPVPYMTVRT
jgi:hypothetical protein